MKFPIGDWQFWIATGAFIASAWWVTRSLVPRLRRRRLAKRATLTIEGRPAPRARRR